MNDGVALDRHDAAEIGLDLGEDVAFGRPQHFGHFRIDAQDDLVMAVDVFRDAARFGEDLVADRLRALHHPAAGAIRARRAEGSFERLLDAFARHGDEAQRSRRRADRGA